MSAIDALIARIGKALHITSTPPSGGSTLAPTATTPEPVQPMATEPVATVEDEA